MGEVFRMIGKKGKGGNVRKHGGQTSVRAMRIYTVYYGKIQPLAFLTD